MDYAPNQLTPMKTPHSNSVLKGPPGTDVGDLDCELGPDDDGYMVTASAWDLTSEQRAKLAAGGHIRLSVWQHPIPPLAMALEGPFCGCGVEMTFDGDAFNCEVPGCTVEAPGTARDGRADFSPAEEIPPDE